MHFDALSLSCICAELQFLCPGRIQNLLLTSPHSIGLEVYAQGARHYLLLSLESEKNGILLVSEKLRRGSEEQPPLLQLLRKYVRDALLTAIVHPDPYERILQLHFRHPEHGETMLVAEPMGRLSNLLLIGNNARILDCLRRVPASDKSQRVLLPGQLYTPPPAQNKIPALDDGSPDYYERLATITQSEEPLWKVLVAQIAGTSPTVAREVAFRTTGTLTTPAQEVDLIALASNLQALWTPSQNGGWQPGVCMEEDKVVGFSAFEMHFRGKFVAVASLSEAIERFWAAAAQKQQQPARDGYATQRKEVAAQLESARRRLQRQLASLASDEPAPGEAEKARTNAEWLLAYSSQIEPRQTTLSVDLGDSLLEIALDPRKSAVQQAQQLFKQAARMERASIFIPQRRSELQRDLEYLEQLEVDLSLALNQPEIAAVRGELDAMGLSSQQKQRTVAPKQARVGQPLTMRSASGRVILVGRSAKQNEEVTFKLSHPRDLWLHVRNVPGAHVIIRSGGEAVDDATIQMAAQLAGYHSKLRDEKSVEVLLCERRFVQHAPGGRTGQVVVRNERVITAPATMPEGGGIERP